MNYAYHHFHLICSDLEQMIRFFTETLGGVLTGRRAIRGAEGATIDLGGIAIWLRAAEPGEQPDAGPTRRHFGFDHLGLAVSNLQQAYEELTAKGITFTVPPASPTARIAFLRGPDNIGIELFQPPS